MDTKENMSYAPMEKEYPLMARTLSFAADNLGVASGTPIRKNPNEERCEICGKKMSGYNKSGSCFFHPKETKGHRSLESQIASKKRRAATDSALLSTPDTQQPGF